MPTVLERMLQQAAVDRDFRGESAEFGVDLLPEPIQEQDLQFYGFLEDTEALEVLNACGSTCSAGPKTLFCDGQTK